MKKYVYSFQEGKRELKDKLGGKGVNLCEMMQLGLPIPQGFIVTTEACNLFFDNKYHLPKNLQKEIFANLKKLEKNTGKKFGDEKNPLLLSVRSGGRVSMPGMMDTILNVGINDKIVASLAKNEQFAWFAYDSYRRFISMYGEIVAGVDRRVFEDEMARFKRKHKAKKDQLLTVEQLKLLIEIYKKKYFEFTNDYFPQEPLSQLMAAIRAVFKSWENPRAHNYRQMNNIPFAWGTAINVVEMVFGNLNNDSATGVVFSRNSATGENEMYGEFLINAQGEDVVAGVRTPDEIKKLKEKMPDMYNQLFSYVKKLEKHYREMQDVEFTIENKKLYILQTRTGKRTMNAGLKIAVDMVKEGLISKETALLRLDANQLGQILHPQFDNKELENAKFLSKGLPASPGAASGKICFNKEELLTLKERGIPAILVRLETSPDDVEAMAQAEGVLTIYGGMTSHAAVVARGMGICCITGCNDFSIKNNKLYLNGTLIKKENYISLHGDTGKVYFGQIKTKPAVLTDEFNKVLKWAHQNLKMQVLANADTPKDAKIALDFYATGIGLCRTEHMFFQDKRMLRMQKMILSTSEKEKMQAVKALEKFQQKDFYNILKVMDKKAVVIRYLDPPLHEFMPKKEEEIKNLAKYLKTTKVKLKKQIANLQEENPMMGHRGSRVSVTYPALLQMQTRAIIKAALQLKKEGYHPKPELMLPLISSSKELSYLIEIIKEEIKNLTKKTTISYALGAMIEVPRALVIADEIAQKVDFVSFGTNDLTQMTYGFSRDDIGKFFPEYQAKKLLTFDPFATLDIKGVGSLIKYAIPKLKDNNKKIVIGICGEHGGDPDSIAFFYENDFNYVSCSSYRLPIAIIKAAQLAILEKENKLEILE